MPTTTPLKDKVNELVLTCPAKVNLALAVGAPGEMGLHPIVSWMVTVHFGDRLRIERSATDQSHIDIAFAPDAPISGKVDWPLDHDLAARAHGLLESKLNKQLPVNVQLQKRIPTGAGLGGGSSDAAGMIVALDRLFDLNLSDDELLSIGAELGSDVPFLVGAMRGQPSAIVAGLGERVEAVPLDHIMYVVLILTGLGCNTGTVYRQFDALCPDAPAEVDPTTVRALATAGFVEQDACFNDLARPALTAYPELAALRDRVAAAVSLPVHVTGSGSTLFILGAGQSSAKLVARKIREETGLTTIVARTMG